jgi:hypothetical protein
VPVDKACIPTQLYLARNSNILKYQWQGAGDVVCLALTSGNNQLLEYLLSIGADPAARLHPLGLLADTCLSNTSLSRHGYPILYCSYCFNMGHLLKNVRATASGSNRESGDRTSTS